jgi:hypothetical protein
VVARRRGLQYGRARLRSCGEGEVDRLERLGERSYRSPGHARGRVRDPNPERDRAAGERSDPIQLREVAQELLARGELARELVYDRRIDARKQLVAGVLEVKAQGDAVELEDLVSFEE